MDLQILIVIACVFLASLFSLLFINKFFRRKTFEEIIAEKKALAKELYASSKVTKKQQQKKAALKKELKKDKRQKLKELQKENDSNNESDGQSESVSAESSPSHKKASHIEFEPEPEIVNDSDSTSQTRPAAVVENGGKTNKQNKKKGNAKSGILINKSEQVAVKEIPVAPVLNHFETKQPKDAVELKKQENDTKKSKESKKSNKNSKKEVEPEIIKEVKQADEKSAKSNDSPKPHANKNNKQQKKNDVDFSILDKLNGSDSIGVNFMMKLFSRAELNRNEIQILIDYLLNKQQDVPANHSEWSDDVVQKLRKQLDEKEKALQEEQEASAGIQAKLRDLRLEINTERAQINATTKVYLEEIQSKKLEITNLNQELQSINEKFNLERQQFQAKLRLEKQSSSQEHLTQIQKLSDHNALLQNDLRNLNELQFTLEDTKQKSAEIINQQANQIRVLEQHVSETEKEIARLRYELEVAKIAEIENESGKVEIQHLQGSLDSAKADLNSLRNELNDTKSKVDTLNAQNEELSKNLANVSDINQKSAELQASVEKFKSLCAEKDTQFAEVSKNLQKSKTQEDELFKQIKELKDKNNDLRTKNWKLVDALQTAETANNKKLTLVQQKTNSSTAVKEDEKVRQLIERLYPEAVKKNAGSALSLPFDQWVEQVLAAHVKQQLTLSNSTNSSSKTHNSSHSQHNHNNNLTNSEHINSNCSQNSSSDEETQKLKSQNTQLRAQIEALTTIVNKTENMLINIESQAREQDAHWRSIVRSKDDEIHLLKTSNGEQQI